jgi:hypothetical protein
MQAGYAGPPCTTHFIILGRNSVNQMLLDRLRFKALGTLHKGSRAQIYDQLPIKVAIADHVDLRNVICDLHGSKPRGYKLMCDGKRLQKMHPGVGLYENGIGKRIWGSVGEERER